jgi:ribonucleoside-diphosphate reductase beta chain
LAWQWEADSTASHSIIPIIAPFTPNTTVWVGWLRITDNESIHGLTYSEIVRNSFINPSTILAEVLAVKESLSRLHEVGAIFANAKSVGLRLQTGELSRNSDEAYEAIFMFTVAMFVLERIQFMASFAITFAIVDTGLFQPIGKAVQKIAQDELEVHCRWDMAILTHEMSTPRGQAAFKRLSPKILGLVQAVERSEVNWVDYMFSNGRELLGMNAKLLKAWVYFNSAAVRTFFNFELAVETPGTNPLRFMENWLDISKTQSSPQEQDNGQYRMNTMRRTDDDVEFDVDF